MGKERKDVGEAYLVVMVVVGVCNYTTGGTVPHSQFAPIFMMKMNFMVKN